MCAFTFLATRKFPTGASLDINLIKSGEVTTQPAGKCWKVREKGYYSDRIVRENASNIRFEVIYFFCNGLSVSKLISCTYEAKNN